MSMAACLAICEGVARLDLLWVLMSSQFKLYYSPGLGFQVQLLFDDHGSSLMKMSANLEDTDSTSLSCGSNPKH